MNTGRLYEFLVLSRLLSYSKAADALYISQSVLTKHIQELEKELDAYELPPKKSLFRKKPVREEAPYLLSWMQEKQESCFVCNRMKENMQRYFDTFFAMLREEEFRTSVEQSKGFCMRHFKRLMEESEENLPNSQREWFRKIIPALMWNNLVRVKEDIDWFVAKNDYRNAGADWKTSRDAVSRGIQKLQGGHPSDPAFRSADFGIKMPGK